jgi:hypothetical protein
MSGIAEFVAAARQTYIDANAGTMKWLLARPRLGGSFLNSKQNSIALADYTDADGWRGPGFTYGWIQGRGLEALATHAAYFAAGDAVLAQALDEAGAGLYGALDALQKRDGHAYFSYDAQMRPVYPGDDSIAVPQTGPADVFTYSDVFVTKGLIAASARHARADAARHLSALDRIVEAIEDGRFQMDEKRPLSAEALAAEPEDFGPRMILLGGAGMLHRLGLADAAGFADRFVAHVLDRHFDTASGLLRNVPGEDACNVGHAIEFVGFALDYLPADADRELVARLEAILLASFAAGFAGPGISLSVSVSTGRQLSPHCPWWSLPETIRAAALCYERTGNPAAMAVWQRAHEAFFANYWRGRPAIAYQTMTTDGPVDFVPATPDLDPGYHTGLSLLAAIEVADRLRIG